MTKISPWAVGAATLLALTAQAGEIETSDWPREFISQEMTTVPVFMDIPLWVRIRDIDKLVIRLIPRSTYEYEGCADVVFETPRNLNVSVRFIPTGAVRGKYSCWLSSSFAEAPEPALNVCVKLETEELPPPMTNVRVGVVTFQVSLR